ncbi:MAG: hypothetical protein HRT35_23255 [Algicola sp.]|nr:hypothetical protein [Algicola sp.]
MAEQAKTMQPNKQQVVQPAGVAQQHKQSCYFEDNRAETTQLQQLQQDIAQSPLMQRQAL